jgi:hypothetical protein
MTPRTYQVDFSEQRPKDGKTHEVYNTNELKSIETSVEPGDIIRMHRNAYGYLDKWDQSGTQDKRIWFEPYGDGEVHFIFTTQKGMMINGKWLHFDGGPEYQIKVTNRKGPGIKTRGDHIRMSKVAFEKVGIDKDHPKNDPTALQARSPNFEFYNLRFNECYGNAIYVANDTDSPIMKNGSIFFCESDTIHGSGVQFNPHQSDEGNYLDGFYRIGGNYYNKVGHQLTKQSIVVTPQPGTDQMHGRVVASGNFIEYGYDGLKAVHNQSCEIEYRTNIVCHCRIGLHQSRADDVGTHSVTWINNDSFDNETDIFEHPKSNSIFDNNRAYPVLDWNGGRLTDMDWNRVLGVDRQIPIPDDKEEEDNNEKDSDHDSEHTDGKEPIDDPPAGTKNPLIVKVKEYEEILKQIHEVSKVAA